jgi:NADH dehydrogenase FAD-containing subunit
MLHAVANSLLTGYRVVVIEKNSHFQLTWVLPRCCVMEGHEHKALIPYWLYLKASLGSYQWITDSVTTIQPGGDGKDRNSKVQVSGDWIEYLILATGSTARRPSRVNWESKEDWMKALQDQQRRFKQARDIVVVGGGAAGVELATDGKSQYPEKNLMLIHSHETLLNDGFGSKMHDVAKKAIEDLGIDLVLGERPVLLRDETGYIELGDRKVHFHCLVSHRIDHPGPESDECRLNALVRSPILISSAFSHPLRLHHLVISMLGQPCW